MKPTTMPAADSRPNRVLIALAAGWMILSLAIGGAVSAQPAREGGGPSQVAADEATQP